MEFSHGSGSLSVREATNFWVRLRASVNGLSVRCGQTLKKSS
jgi:hypothetical protein